MPRCRIDAELSSIISGESEKLLDLLRVDLVGCDILGKIRACAVRLLQVGPVSADPYDDALAHLLRVHGPRINVIAEGFDLELQAVCIALAIGSEVEEGQELFTGLFTCGDAVEVRLH